MPWQWNDRIRERRSNQERTHRPYAGVTTNRKWRRRVATRVGRDKY